MQRYLKGILMIVMIIGFYTINSAQIQDDLIIPYTQNSIIESEENTTSTEFQLLNFSNDMLQLDLLNYTHKNRWSCNFLLWLDENTTAESKQFIYNDVFNYNINLTYSYRSFQFLFQIVNIFKLSNNDFAIEPSRENNIGGIVNFEHVPMQQIGLGIVYTF